MTRHIAPPRRAVAAVMERALGSGRRPTRRSACVAAALALGLALSGPTHADTLTEAFTASGAGDCETAIPLLESALATSLESAQEIDASHALAICLAGTEDAWRAREIMAELLPTVLAFYGPASAGLARHHGLWAEAEVRAGALNVAWRRSEAAITALRAAGQLDPYDHAAEIYRLAAVQIARGEEEAFRSFLAAEREKLAKADWAAPGDDELFAEAVPPLPAPVVEQAAASEQGTGASHGGSEPESEAAPADETSPQGNADAERDVAAQDGTGNEGEDPETLGAWTLRGLQEFEPRPLYSDLLEPQS